MPLPAICRQRHSYMSALFLAVIVNLARTSRNCLRPNAFKCLLYMQSRSGEAKVGGFVVVDGISLAPKRKSPRHRAVGFISGTSISTYRPYRERREQREREARACR